MNLNGKNAIVTGSSRGIGAAIAKTLADYGARVCVTYSKSSDSAKRVFDSLKGGDHLLMSLDTSNEESVNTFFNKVLKEWQNQVDILVNNAGITKDQLLLRMKVEDFDSVYNVNLRGSFLCTKAVIKPMMKAKKGSIINLSSVIGSIGNPGQSNYAATKAGIEAFSKSVAKELGSRGIRVNSVAPGFIKTEMTNILDDKQKEVLLNNLPLGRLGETDDISNAVAFLASDLSAYITGQCLHVNGGMYLR